MLFNWVRGFGCKVPRVVERRSGWESVLLNLGVRFWSQNPRSGGRRSRCGSMLFDFTGGFNLSSYGSDCLPILVLVGVEGGARISSMLLNQPRVKG